jgi:3-oxoacyl-[acyl-carrier protein] reductase
MRERGCAVVTGGSRGIGSMIARSLAEEGWPVAINYRSDDDAAGAVVNEVRASGGTAIAFAADISRSEAVDEMFAALEEQFDHVSVLINNAGIISDALCPRISETAWRDVINTNLTGAFLTCRRAVMPMVRSRFGRIVNIASIVGPSVANPGQANYAASKAGLVALTRTIAREVAHRGVTANAVAPGLIDTELSAPNSERFVQGVPARRRGTPEEVAACVRFLASAEASYVTGTTLTVDGGMTA